MRGAVSRCSLRAPRAGMMWTWEVGLVVGAGRGAEPSFDRWKPLLEQEGLDGQLGRLDKGAVVEAGELGAERLLGGLLGGEAVPAVETSLAGVRAGGAGDPGEGGQRHGEGGEGDGDGGLAERAVSP